MTSVVACITITELISLARSRSHTLYSSLSSTIGHTTPSLLCYEPRIYKNYKFLFITPEEACGSVLNVLVDLSIWICVPHCHQKSR